MTIIRVWFEPVLWIHGMEKGKDEESDEKQLFSAGSTSVLCHPISLMMYI